MWRNLNLKNFENLKSVAFFWFANYVLWFEYLFFIRFAINEIYVNDMFEVDTFRMTKKNDKETRSKYCLVDNLKLLFIFCFEFFFLEILLLLLWRLKYCYLRLEIWMRNACSHGHQPKGQHEHTGKWEIQTKKKFTKQNIFNKLIWQHTNVKNVI